jgi:hypothetical protein
METCTDIYSQYSVEFQNTVVIRLKKDGRRIARITVEPEMMCETFRYFDSGKVVAADLGWKDEPRDK